MRLPRGYIEYMARALVERLIAAAALETPAPDKLRERLRDVIVEELTVEDRNTVRLEIMRIMTDLLREEERMGELARQKILSQKKPIPEGSTEWETLYRKYYSEELRKLGVD